MTTGIVPDDSLAAQLDLLKDFVGDANAVAPLDGAKSLLPHLGDDPTAQDAFAWIARSHLPATAALEDKIPDDFMTAPGDDLLRRLGRPFRPSRPLPDGGRTAMMGTGSAAAGEGAPPWRWCEVRYTAVSEAAAATMMEDPSESLRKWRGSPCC